MKVREPDLSEAAAICEIVRASIKDLCRDDHSDDSLKLDRWLANKTPQNVARWISNSNNINLVGAMDERIVAAACMTLEGAIILNYVAPAMRFQGLSKMLLRAMEISARSRGIPLCTLESTSTALRFYLDRGYKASGPQRCKNGMPTFPMRKLL
jgi:hypothetical protein